MRLLATILITGAVLIAGCAGGAQQEMQDDMDEGWMPLFDGESIEHWRGFRQESLPENWQVANGSIYYNGEGGGDIVTRESYADFEFSFEWKISEAGNSGIIYRADEEHDTAWMTGPEYQILDNYGHPDAGQGNDRLAGANYDMHPVSPDAAKPAGEWNTGRIVANGAHVEHWLNGEKVVEYELWSDEWNERVQESKWTDYPDYGSLEEGHIALQDHGDPVWYRNLKIRRLGD